MNKGTKVSLIVFLTFEIVIFTGFFLLGFECNTINILALCFLGLSLLVSMFSTISLAKEKNGKDTLFYNAGIGSITVMYQIAVIISVLLANAFENNVKGFVFLQITINILMFVICTLIVAISTYIRKCNEKTLEKQNNGDYNKPKRGSF